MQTPLSRIEKEYILNFFCNEKPTLTLFYLGNFYKTMPTEYNIYNNLIIFENKNYLNFENKEIKIFFSHKERPLYFISKIKKNNKKIFCKLPQEIYKETSLELNNNPCFKLKTSSGFIMKIQNIKKIKLNHKKDNEEYNLTKNKILNLINHNQNKFSEEIIETIFSIEKNSTTIKTTTSIIFIDANSILILCSKKNADTIYSSIANHAEISFKERKIKASLQYNFFYKLSKENIMFFTDKSQHKQTKIYGILCLEINKIHEEDKRFLHEYTYHTKYGVNYRKSPIEKHAPFC